MKVFQLATLATAQWGGTPGTGGVGKRPRPAIDHNVFGRPGEAKLVQAPKTFRERETIFNDYLKRANIPFYWSRDAQIEAIVDRIGGPVPTNEFNGPFIAKLSEALLHMPEYGDVPPPPGQQAVKVPKWVPDTSFGERGPPGELSSPHAKSGKSWLNEQKELHGDQHGGGNIYDELGPPGEQQRSRQVKFDDIKWLQSYGYLPKPESGKSASISQAGHQAAIRELQYNYGLEETGELNEETIFAMKQPRCGQKDTKRSTEPNVAEARSSSSDGPSGYKINEAQAKWKKSPVTWSILGYTPDMPPELVARVFDQALNVWQDVAQLDFQRLDDNDPEADIRIYFGYYDHGDAWAFNGANGILAHAFFPDGAYKDLMGDMHFDESEFWTLGKGQVVRAVLGSTLDPDADNYCHFPFFYDGIEYNGCSSGTTPNGRKKAKWCSLTKEWEGKWGYCGPDVMTFGGNANGEMCHFPFTFLGKQYDRCTSEGREDGYYWCSPDASFDEDGRYGFCLQDTDSTVGGNGDSAPCVFPFTFQGHQYNECTTVGRNDNYLWCATTDNYDTDKMFGFCSQQEYSLFHVAAHEAGHAIGLDHSSMRDALMYPSYHIRNDWQFDYANIRQSYQLPDDDRRGAQQLYGRRTGPMPTTRSTSRWTTTTRTMPRTTRRTTSRTTTTRPTQNTCDWTNWSDWSQCRNSYKQRYRTCESQGDSLTKNVCQCDGENTEGQSCGVVVMPTTTTIIKPTVSVDSDNDDDNCNAVTTTWTSELCRQPFDAILQYAMETFIFRDDQLWRIEGENHYSAAFVSQWQVKGPFKTSNYWADLPSRIDAVYRVPEDRSQRWASGHVRFFSGQRYWEFKGFRIEPGYPKSISELGLPTSLRFNAAINRRIGKGKTYRRFTFLFSGNRFYVYDEKTRKIVGQRQGYDMRRSPIIGLPHSARIVGATPANDDGHSYFFTHDTYYRVDDKDSRVNYAGRIADDFLHCCKVETSRPDQNQIITGSGVCKRTNDFYDYMCGFDPSSLMSKGGPSLMVDTDFADLVAGWPREFFKFRFRPDQVIVHNPDSK